MRPGRAGAAWTCRLACPGTGAARRAGWALAHARPGRAGAAWSYQRACPGTGAARRAGHPRRHTVGGGIARWAYQAAATTRRRAARGHQIWHGWQSCLRRLVSSGGGRPAVVRLARQGRQQLRWLVTRAEGQTPHLMARALPRHWARGLATARSNSSPRCPHSSHSRSRSRSSSSRSCRLQLQQACLRLRHRRTKRQWQLTHPCPATWGMRGRQGTGEERAG